jgi:hypothetical protein
MKQFFYDTRWLILWFGVSAACMIVAVLLFVAR